MDSSIRDVSPVPNAPEVKSLDARLQTKHHDVDVNKDRSQRHDDQEIVSEQENDTLISLQALILFLEDMLEQQIDESSLTKNAGFSRWVKAPDNVPLAPRGRVIKAYEHAAEVTGWAQKEPLKKDEEKGPDPDVLKKVYALIRELRALSNENVQYLRLENDKPLLDGVSGAIAQIRQSRNI